MGSLGQGQDVRPEAFSEDGGLQVQRQRRGGDAEQDGLGLELLDVAFQGVPGLILGRIIPEQDLAAASLESGRGV